MAFMTGGPPFANDIMTQGHPTFTVVATAPRERFSYTAEQHLLKDIVADQLLE
jgi:hypothetical protein